MRILEDRIVKEGRILPGDVLKVDSFLNHQLDTVLISEIGREFHRLFKDCDVTKILTIEASGIAVSFATSQFFNYCPVVFAKKGGARNIGDDVYHSTCHSYTRGGEYNILVSRNYLSKDDRILILDDFLASGEAMKALIDIARQAGCTIAGCGAVIEKAYQGGAEIIEGLGVRLESLARIRKMSVEEGIDFCR